MHDGLAAAAAAAAAAARVVSVRGKLRGLLREHDAIKSQKVPGNLEVVSKAIRTIRRKRLKNRRPSRTRLVTAAGPAPSSCTGSCWQLLAATVSMIRTVR